MEAPCKRKDPEVTNTTSVTAEKSTTTTTSIHQPTNAAAQDSSNTKESTTTNIVTNPTRVRRRFTDTPPTTLQQPQQAPVNKESAKEKATKDTVPKISKAPVSSQPSSVHNLRQLSIDERDDVVMDIIPSPPPPVKSLINYSNSPSVDKSSTKKDIPVSKNNSVDKLVSEQKSDKRKEAQDQQPNTHISVTTSDNNGSVLKQSEKSSEKKVIEETRSGEGANEIEKGSQLIPEHRETATVESNHVRVSDPATLPVDAQATSIPKDTEKTKSETKNTKISLQPPVVNTSSLTTPTQSPSTTTSPTSANSTPTLTSSPTSIDALSRPKKKKGRLPPHWKVKMGDDDFYYVNTLTGEKSFTRPEV